MITLILIFLGLASFGLYLLSKICGKNASSKLVEMHALIALIDLVGLLAVGVVISLMGLDEIVLQSILKVIFCLLTILGFYSLLKVCEKNVNSKSMGNEYSIASLVGFVGIGIIGFVLILLGPNGIL